MKRDGNILKAYKREVSMTEKTYKDLKKYSREACKLELKSSLEELYEPIEDNFEEIYDFSEEYEGTLYNVGGDLKAFFPLPIPWYYLTPDR